MRTSSLAVLAAVALLPGCNEDDRGSMSADTDSSAGGSSSGVAGSSGIDDGFLACERDDTPPFAPRAVVFLNFDGVRLRGGEQYAPDDPTENRTSYSPLLALNNGDPLEAVEDDRDRDCIVQAVRDDFARFNLWITDVRPTSGTYTMVVVSPSLMPDGAVVAQPDCRNARGPGIVAVSSRGPLHVEAQAGLISGAIGLSFGLDPVDRRGEVMHPEHVDDDPIFLDECLVLDGGSCGHVQWEFCPEGRQNSVAYLQGLEFSP